MMMERQSSIAFESIDSETPVNSKLCAKYTRSFAYYTVKDRLPVILTKAINDLVINRGKLVQDNGGKAEDVKAVIGKISKLKNELVTNKQLTKLISNGDDIDQWNSYLESVTNDEKEPPCWYHSPWLYVECYMYRRLWEIFETSATLKDFDVFSWKKEEAFRKSLPEMKRIANRAYPTLTELEITKKNIQEKFFEFMKLSLWSNRFDLSLSSAEQISDDCDLNKIREYDSHILCDDSSKVFEYFKRNPGINLDFVHDNASFEIFSDFCFCDFLCSSSLAAKIRLHVKRLPWYVSDATRHDVKWLLDAMSAEGMSKLATRWNKYFEDGVWTVHDEAFWTLPFDYSEMKQRDPQLYKSLEDSGLVLFKGDLNYRKLLGDINWDHGEKFRTALRDFTPTNVVSLRTVKADLICGLMPGKTDAIQSKDKNWMTTGEYAVIQFYCNI